MMIGYHNLAKVKYMKFFKNIFKKIWAFFTGKINAESASVIARQFQISKFQV